MIVLNMVIGGNKDSVIILKIVLVFVLWQAEKRLFMKCGC